MSSHVFDKHSDAIFFFSNTNTRVWNNLERSVRLKLLKFVSPADRIALFEFFNFCLLSFTFVAKTTQGFYVG